ncbi:MAG: NUDIX hydrolase N-terminal domain-containing protein [Microscillaceae bacterium]|nr:NUDIX hydrolase N-terminal domain-containing protein [Microscillaceae bacterium]
MENFRKEILNKIKRIKALSQNGLSYSESHFDLERFEELDHLSDALFEMISGLAISDIRVALQKEDLYQTPKVDIRAVIFKDRKLLLVCEKSDHRWALPGGWADIGYSPSEVAVKEVQEEAGLVVKAERLLAVYDKRLHSHPESLLYVYKIFILCSLVGGEAQAGIDIEAVDFFEADALPELSVGRNTEAQILEMFTFLDAPDQPPYLD